MTHPSGRRRPVLPAVALLAAALALVAGCASLREPAYDPAIAGAVTELAVESRSLFRSLRADPPEAFAARADLYARLSARAEAVRMMADTRPTPPPRPLAEAGGALLSRLLASREMDPDAAREAYGPATQAFMADYLRNLDWLETADRATPDGPPPGDTTRLRIAALTEVLRDALTYERRILRRGE